jgi:predicted nucleotidyltransferase
MKTQAIIDWTVFNFRAYSRNISTIGIYGSVARGVDRPNDCDLLIIASVDVESEKWFSLREHINSIKIDFLKNFELPLNVTLLTEGEWLENKSFFKDLTLIQT